MSVRLGAFPLFFLILCGAYCHAITAVAQVSASPSSLWIKPEFTDHPLTGLRVALDIGHYLEKPGATSARGKTEYTFNSATARAIETVLESAGAQVILVNAEGNVSGLRDRPAIAARAKADCFISIHHDAVNDQYIRHWYYQGVNREYCDNFRGYGVFTSAKNSKAEKSRELALALGRALYDAGLRPALHHAEPIQGENRPLIDSTTGVYEFSDLVVLKSATIPALLLECGVIVHRDEELMVQMPEYRQLLGYALVKALSQVFPKKEKSKVPSLKGLFQKSPKQ